LRGRAGRFEAACRSHAQTHYLLDAKWEHYHKAIVTKPVNNWIGNCLDFRLRFKSPFLTCVAYTFKVYKDDIEKLCHNIFLDLLQIFILYLIDVT
jgi:hypothetical protein